MPFLCEAFGPEATAEPVPRAVIATAETVLLTALRPDVGLALWLRELPPAIPRACSPLLRAAPFRALGEGTPEEALDQAAAALPGEAPLDVLADALRLSHLFCALIRRETLRIRLDGVTGDACRKFHVDAVGFRLLVTYAGVGTQWTLADPDAGGHIHDVPAGAAALFRGRARPGAHVLHRSPPISALPQGLPTAQRNRLVLVLDEPQEARP